MDRLEDFCSGERGRELRFYFFQEYLKNAKIENVEMIEDKKKVNKGQWGMWGVRGIGYTLVGLGYGYVINVFTKSRSMYFVMPVACCMVFGYYDYYGDRYEKYKLADKYEIHTHKHFCKKYS